MWPLLLLPVLLLGLSEVAVAQTPAGITVSQEELWDYWYAFSAHTASGAQNCGANGVLIANGWTTKLEQYADIAAATALTEVASTAPPTPFANSGTITIPINGYYYVSAFARCERQACDCTVRASGTRVAAFGMDRVERWENRVNQSGGPIGAYWSSHGVAFFRRFTTGQTIQLYFESGQTNDCFYDTSYFYGQFNCFLYLSDGP